MHRYIQSFTSPTIKGWLMKKARTGLRKTWTRRYFVLESQQLRCYKNDQDESIPISIFDLREYQLQNQSSTKPFTFQLIRQSSKSSSSTAQPISPSLPSPDLYLQAENEKEWSNWVDTLERHVGDQQHLVSNAIKDSNIDYFDHYDDDKVDILDKWLERYDLIVPRKERCTSSLLSLAPSSNYDMNGDEVDDNDDSDLEDMSRQQQQQLQQLTTPLTPITEKHPQAIKPSTSTASSSSSTPKSSSSPRFLGFLWTTNSKRSKPPSNASASSSSSSSPPRSAGGIH